VGTTRINHREHDQDQELEDDTWLESEAALMGVTGGTSNCSAQARARQARSQRNLHEVRLGDTWQSLAAYYCGDADRWLELYQANSFLYDSPLDPLVPGAFVQIPADLVAAERPPPSPQCEGKEQLGQTPDDAVKGGAKLPHAEPSPVIQTIEDGYQGAVFLKVPTPMQMGKGGQRRFNVRLLDTEWQASIKESLAAALLGFAQQLRNLPGGPELDFADVPSQAGEDAYNAVRPFVEASLQDRLLPDGFSPQGVLNFAKEYPVLAFLGGMVAGAAATAYLADTIMKKGVLALDAGPVSGKLNLETMDWEFMIRVTFKF
jgi:hypothetical protein